MVEDTKEEEEEEDESLFYPLIRMQVNSKMVHSKVNLKHQSIVREYCHKLVKDWKDQILVGEKDQSFLEGWIKLIEFVIKNIKYVIEDNPKTKSWVTGFSGKLFMLLLRTDEKLALPLQVCYNLVKFSKKGQTGGIDNVHRLEVSQSSTVVVTIQSFSEYGYLWRQMMFEDPSKRNRPKTGKSNTNIQQNIKMLQDKISARNRFRMKSQDAHLLRLAWMYKAKKEFHSLNTKGEAILVFMNDALRMQNDVNSWQGFLGIKSIQNLLGQDQGQQHALTKKLDDVIKAGEDVVLWVSALDLNESTVIDTFFDQKEDHIWDYLPTFLLPDDLTDETKESQTFPLPDDLTDETIESPPLKVKNEIPISRILMEMFPSMKWVNVSGGGQLTVDDVYKRHIQHHYKQCLKVEKCRRGKRCQNCKLSTVRWGTLEITSRLEEWRLKEQGV